MCVLLVTDEQSDREVCLLGTSDGLLRAIGGARYFKFVLADVYLERFVFDTHENIPRQNVFREGSFATINRFRTDWFLIRAGRQ